MKMKKSSPPNSLKATAVIAVRKVDSDKLKVKKELDQSGPEAFANKILQPSVQAALSVLYYNTSVGEIDANTLESIIHTLAESASEGDLSHSVRMLVAQAQTLDTIFNTLARRAAKNESIQQYEMNLRLALKTQSQCRSTLEAIALIKNPQSIAFVKQANISNGPQQINNVEPALSEISKKAKNQPNKVLEDQHGKRMVGRAPKATIAAHPAMEAMGSVNRA